MVVLVDELPDQGPAPAAGHATSLAPLVTAPAAPAPASATEHVENTIQTPSTSKIAHFVT